MFNKANKKILYRFIAVVIVLFGLLTGAMITSQSNVSAHCVRRARTKRVIRRTHTKRIIRNKIQRRRTKATHQVKRIKRNRRVRRMVKHAVRRKGRSRKRMTKVHKEVRSMKIERRSTSKDPVSVTPEDQN